MIEEICTERREHKIEDIKAMIKMHFRTVKYEITNIFTEINNINNEVLKV